MENGFKSSNKRATSGSLLFPLSICEKFQIMIVYISDCVIQTWNGSTEVKRLFFVNAKAAFWCGTFYLVFIKATLKVDS